jgi:predicted ATPase/class 3 adenylate cyclase
VGSLPTGSSVTFLFTDIEGSTRLEQRLGSDTWADVVARHDALLRAAIEANRGVVVKTEGDAFFAAFADPADAVTGAVGAQRALASEPWTDGCEIRVRMGLHLGEGRLRAGRAEGDPEDYVGIDVNYAARIAAAANGGQIVLSDALVRAAGASAGAGGSLVDEGLRAVKDFEDPQRLHRLAVPGVADDDRRLRTLDPPTNLPGEVTDLVGREAEIDAIATTLTTSRIVTLTGPGGSGKTRLGLAVAARIRDRFPHGTWFVDLAAVRDPALVEGAIGAALGLRESPAKAMPEVLREHLRGRTELVVLDNLEQLLPGAAAIVAELARVAPDLRFLITSRELLRIAGERGHAVPPLEAAAGIRLFEARAEAHRPGLALSDVDRIAIGKICERVQGLPLAIELAAARVRLLSPTLILDRLASSLDLAGGARDLPERQRTLRGAIDWSHELLSEPERRLFRRLAVFAGGWTGELALQVADPAGDLGVDMLEGLESLADKSLVRIEAAGADPGAATDGPRFDLHPLLREYAAERLEASGERDVVEARHAAAIAELAESLGPAILSPTGGAAIARLDREQHNVRDALQWARTTGSTDVGLRIMGSLWRWFQQRGRIREARAELAQLLPVGPADQDPLLRIRALAAEGGLAYWASDHAAARAAYEERLALAEASGDAALLADAHYDIGFSCMVAKDVDGLRRHEQLAFDLYTQLGRKDGALRARQALVLGVYHGGDYARALELETVNLAEFRAGGSQYQIADSSTLHSAIYFQLGDAPASWEWMREGLRMFVAAQNPSGIVRGLGMAAILELAYGDPEVGARLTGTVYQLLREKGLMLAPVAVLHLPDPAVTAVERLGEARAQELQVAGAQDDLDAAIADVLARETVSTPTTAGR